MEVDGQIEIPIGQVLFVLQGARADKTVVLKGKYSFVDGKLCISEKQITQGTQRMLEGLGAKMFTQVPGAKPRPVGDSKGPGLTYPEDEEPAADATDGQPALKDEKLWKVLQELDPDDDTHWVMTGPNVARPRIDAVAEKYGSTDVNRGMIDDVAPDWTREKAREAQSNAGS